MIRHVRYHKVLIPVAWLAIGAALAGAAATGNEEGLSRLLLVIAIVGAGVLAFIARGSSDVAAVVGAKRDERQASLDLRARSIVAVAAFAICAAQAARWFLNGHSQLAQPYLLLCAAFAITYLGSLIVIARRH